MFRLMSVGRLHTHICIHVFTMIYGYIEIYSVLLPSYVNLRFLHNGKLHAGKIMVLWKWKKLAVTFLNDGKCTLAFHVMFLNICRTIMFNGNVMYIWVTFNFHEYNFLSKLLNYWYMLPCYSTQMLRCMYHMAYLWIPLKTVAYFHLLVIVPGIFSHTGFFTFNRVF